MLYVETLISLLVDCEVFLDFVSSLFLEIFRSNILRFASRRNTNRFLRSLKHGQFTEINLPGNFCAGLTHICGFPEDSAITECIAPFAFPSNRERADCEFKDLKLPDHLKNDVVARLIRGSSGSEPLSVMVFGHSHVPGIALHKVLEKAFPPHLFWTRSLALLCRIFFGSIQEVLALDDFDCQGLSRSLKYRLRMVSSALPSMNWNEDFARSCLPCEQQSFLCGSWLWQSGISAQHTATAHTMSGLSRPTVYLSVLRLVIRSPSLPVFAKLHINSFACLPLTGKGTGPPTNDWPLHCTAAVRRLSERGESANSSAYLS